MLYYVGRRILQLIPVFLGATLLIYAMVFAMPGDPVQALGGDRGISPELAAQIRAEYNLDKPFIVQYLIYLKNIFVLDFGTTFSGRPVGELIAEAFPVTAKLALMALCIEG
ncbi:MAG: ABC transporter permease, partial [Actinomycetales bacterium]